MSNFAINPNTSHALTVGIDIAKRVHQLHGVDQETGEVFSTQLKSAELFEFFRGRPACHIAMEGCGGSQYLAREFQSMGHIVELLHPKAVKPFVQGCKSDKNDAAGIYAAMQQPHVTRVGIKSVDIQNIATLLTIREGVVKDKTSHINRVHGLFLEYGIALTKGRMFVDNVFQAMSEFETHCGNNASVIDELHREIQVIQECVERIKEIEKALDELVKNTKHGKRFMTIPGIKTVTAAAVVVAIPDPNAFRNGRAFASRVGLVPGFTGSGGKLVMLGITKRGDKRLRKLLVQAAITFANRTKKEKQPKYFERLLTEKPNMVAYVAIAAHLARSLWAMAKREEDFKLIPEALQ